MRFAIMILAVLMFTACASKPERFYFNSNVNAIEVYIHGDQYEYCITPCSIEVSNTKDIELSLSYILPDSEERVAWLTNGDGFDDAYGFQDELINPYSISFSEDIFDDDFDPPNLDLGDFGDVFRGLDGMDGSGAELVLISTIGTLAVYSAVVVVYSASYSISTTANGVNEWIGDSDDDYSLYLETSVIAYDRNHYYIYLQELTVPRQNREDDEPTSKVLYIMDESEYASYVLQNFSIMKQELYYAEQPFITALIEASSVDIIPVLLADSNDAIEFLDAITLAKIESILASEPTQQGRIDSIAKILWYDADKLYTIQDKLNKEEFETAMSCTDKLCNMSWSSTFSEYLQKKRIGAEF
ncbi:MAG: hypothetical protein LBV04_07870 [Deferribacteraceae bacterium]|jgi:hypothetical protein|nr:hypothetical protein [Deferribacteraceae bacterium]